MQVRHRQNNQNNFAFGQNMPVVVEVLKKSVRRYARVNKDPEQYRKAVDVAINQLIRKDGADKTAIRQTRWNLGKIGKRKEQQWNSALERQRGFIISEEVSKLDTAFFRAVDVLDIFCGSSIRRQ